MSALVPKVTRELTKMRRTQAGLEASQLNSALTSQEHEENLEEIQTEKSEWGHDFRPAYLSPGAAVKTLGVPQRAVGAF